MKENIVLLHGALGSIKQLLPLERLLSNKFNTYTFNFEGHGDKTCNSDFSIDLFTENTIDFLTQNDIKKVNVFGYSMGGYVGLNLALNYSKYINSVVTLGTKFNWSKEAAEKEVKMLNPVLIEEKVPKFANSLKETHFPNDWKILLKKTAKMMIGLANGNKLTQQELNKINHNILIGIGSSDKMVSIEESKGAANQLKNGYLKIIDNFQHPIEKNDYAQLAKIVIEFIEGK